MCSQLIQNVKISSEICANVSGDSGRAAEERGGAAEKVRGRFGEGSVKVQGMFGGGSAKVRRRFEEGSGKVRKASGGASARPPCGHLYGIPIIPLLEPASELAIREYFV